MLDGPYIIFTFCENLGIDFFVRVSGSCMRQMSRIGTLKCLCWMGFCLLEIVGLWAFFESPVFHVRSMRPVFVFRSNVVR